MNVRTDSGCANLLLRKLPVSQRGATLGLCHPTVPTATTSPCSLTFPDDGAVPTAVSEGADKFGDLAPDEGC